jgi:hypothetical protein
LFLEDNPMHQKPESILSLISENFSDIYNKWDRKAVKMESMVFPGEKAFTLLVTLINSNGDFYEVYFREGDLFEIKEEIKTREDQDSSPLSIDYKNDTSYMCYKYTYDKET